MTVKEEQNNTGLSANPQREKMIASLREQIAASTSDEERAIFESALQQELARKDKPISAPVAQTMDQDKDPEPKEEEEKDSCCTRLLIEIGDLFEEQREREEDAINTAFTKDAKNAKDAKNEQK